MVLKDRLSQKPYYLNDVQIQWVKNTLSNMTQEEKIRQLFCMITYSDNEEYLKGMAEKGYGGLMCRPMSKKELINTATVLQKYSKIPFLIAANMEAGMNQTCTTGTYVGTQMSIGATGNTKYASELGRIIGEEASRLGLNWAFAPVIDIDYNWRNPITNTRTYGSDPKLVAQMGEEYVTALQKYDIAASIKHFPGDGVDERDQHLVTSINSLSKEDWMKTFGEAYKRSIDAGVLTVMIGHIMQPAWSKALNPELKDEEIMPATLSKELIMGLLRGKLNFNGTTVTDSSAMAGLGCAMARKDALPLCVAAGCDMILFTKNEEEDLKYITDGVEKGIITQERLNEAVTNILALKAALKLPEKKADGSIYPDLSEAEKVVGCKEHLRISKEIADNAITLVKEEKGVLPLSPEKYPRILVYGKENGMTADGFGTESKAGIFVDMLRKEGYQVDLYVPAPGFEGVVAPMADTTDKYDLLIYLANMATKSNQTTVRIEWAQPMGADCPIFIHEVPTIFISLENPYHLVDVPRIRTYINTYGSSQCVMETLIEKLQGKSEFKGKSPVDPFCNMWDTRLY
ncbi:glycoside hydrolase family 3 protein [Clostridium sp. SYSU_GA19001]|uniref:glycoside hydrolase family 3 protein n=1 Tax=Clostridium caldaquaticum TaxID=2940653 RepID=UPI0020770D2A|nr:glycoside hydrolase family 3 N-terminal domain-containing protein [Clostridium caldaquaticum]MCM8709953.1 glycoside hydrolase family 3 protein [Clostridium caldaquaticum]